MKAGGQLPVFRFCARCGHPDPARVSVSEFTCSSCGYRHFINPVSAAVALVRDRHGHLLLIRRAKDPGKGLLGLPGGFVDSDETAEEALRREVFEEVGLRLEAVAYFTSLPNRYLFQGFDWPVLDLFFLAQVESFEQAQAKVEVQSLEIVAPQDLRFEEIAFPSNAQALRLYLDRNAGGRASRQESGL